MYQDIYEEMEKLETFANFLGFFEKIHEEAIQKKDEEIMHELQSILEQSLALKRSYISGETSFNQAYETLNNFYYYIEKSLKKNHSSQAANL